jgi:hypothetical protein
MDNFEIEEVPGNTFKTVEGVIPLWSANVKSSFIRSVHYNVRTLDLTLTFRDGNEHTYADVPPVVYISFMMSNSKGRYFNANIRDSYSTS